jgi:hypothetical protein
MTSSDYEGTVVVHYNREEIQKEIARFSRDRWIAVHCELLNKKGRQYILRYRRVAKNKTPPAISEPWNAPTLLERFMKLRPRTFYAFANVYG